MFIRAETRRNYIGVRAGTLDDPDLGKPEMTIWIKSAPSWASIDAGIPCVEGQPSPPVVLPKA
jgi:hypothetical protein